MIFKIKINQPQNERYIYTKFASTYIPINYGIVDIFLRRLSNAIGHDYIIESGLQLFDVPKTVSITIYEITVVDIYGLWLFDNSIRDHLPQHLQKKIDN